MATKKKSTKAKKPKRKTKAISKVSQQKSIDVTVIYTKEPFAQKDQVIHPRMKMPTVTKGKNVPDKTPSAPINVDKSK